MRGKIVSIEGIDGAGKTTLIDLLASELRYAGHEITQIASIHDKRMAALIRQHIEDGHGAKSSHMAILFGADLVLRDDYIQRSLDAGVHVLMDRYKLSSRCYQLGCPFVEDILSPFQDPDVEIVLDLPVKTAQSRVLAGRGYLDKYESDFDMMHRIRGDMMRLTTGYVVDADADMPQVLACVQEIVCDFIK